MAGTVQSLEKLLPRKQVAEEIFQMTLNAFTVGVHSGRFDGLPVIRVGRRCYYSPSDILAFLARHKVSRPGPGPTPEPDTEHADAVAAAG